MHATGTTLTASSASCSQLAGLHQRRHARSARRLPVRPQAGLFDNIFDFESWAPRSSQAWRLGNNLADSRSKGDDGKIGEDEVEVLNQRLAEARQSEPRPVLGATAGSQAVAAAEGAEESVFLRSTDEEFANALASRIAEVASVQGVVGASSSSIDSTDESDGTEGGGLTGPLIRELMQTKWGKSYDLSFVRRDLPLGKTLICLNVMWTHLEQRSFPMTEEDYNEKLDLVALYINSWGQAERVESFLRQPARPRKGMPSKPIVGTAISIQLDLEDAVINEFFAQGGA